MSGKSDFPDIAAGSRLQDSQYSDDDSDSHSPRGILEFSTEKAGRDVTPLNLNFERKPRSSTLNSITGMLAQLKRSFPDLHHHKTHQPLHNTYSQSTPQPLYSRRPTVRRQSSAGGLHDTSPLTVGAADVGADTPAHSATAPVSSSTNQSSYYTNASPSPTAQRAHNSCDSILNPPAQAHLYCNVSPRTLHRSANNIHQAGRPQFSLNINGEQQREPLTTATPNTAQESVSPQYQNVPPWSGASAGAVLARLDELSRRVAALESGLTADVRLILQLLRAAQPPHATATLTVPRANEGTWEWSSGGGRGRGVQRSASEPHAPPPPALPPPHSHSFHR